MILIIIGIVISFILFFIGLWRANDDSKSYLCLGAIFGIIVMYLFIILEDNIKTNTPTALDVYRGKTTLEITYRDSVAIDSTVIYKDATKAIIIGTFTSVIPRNMAAPTA